MMKIYTRTCLKMDLLRATYLLRKLSVLTLLILMQVSQPGHTAEAEAPKVKELIEAEEEQKKQKEQQAKTAPPKATPADKYDRGTPRSTVLALSEALKERDYELALNYLDMRNVPDSVRRQGRDLARQLKIIVDRSLWADIDSISGDPKGHSDDDLPSHRDIIARLKTPEGPVDILLQRGSDDQDNPIWKLSNHSVSQIPRLYKHFGYGKYGD